MRSIAVRDGVPSRIRADSAAGLRLGDTEVSLKQSVVVHVKGEENELLQE